MGTANATITINGYPKGKDNTERHDIVFGTVAIDASPATYGSVGCPVVLANPEQAKSVSDTPVWGDVQGLSGYIYRYDPGNGTVRIFDVAGSSFSPPLPMTELTVGKAIPTAVSGDTVYAKLEFLLNV
jgi:hypothetical protein